MKCLECAALGRAFKVALDGYTEARAAPFYRVSTELAAIKNVDMERARASIQEHKLVCRFTGQVGQPRTPMLRTHPTLGMLHG